MSDPQSTPRPKPAKPIKASEKGAEAAAAGSTPLQKKDYDKSKGKRRDRGEQAEPKARVNPALMRGPRPSQRKPEPEPIPEVVEEPVAIAEPEEPVAVAEPEEPVAVAEPEEPVAVAEPEEPIAVVEPEEPVAVAEPEEPVAVAETPQPQEV